MADASVTVADILTLSAMAAELGQRRSFAEGGVLTGDHLDVAEQSGPAGRAGALVRLVHLVAGGAVETRPVGVGQRHGHARHGTPVDEALATGAGESVRAVADVGPQSVAAGGAVEARTGVAFVDPELAVGSGESWRADARVVVDAVDARAVAHAGARRAVLVVGPAVGTCSNVHICLYLFISVYICSYLFVSVYIGSYLFFIKFF